VTQRLKLEPSPISQTRVAKVFSPVCECETDVAPIEFDLRRADHLRVAIRIDGRERVIADAEFRRGHVRVAWDGRDASGVPVSDGTYFPVVHMLRAQRTIDLPNPIRVDTRRPTIAFTGLQQKDGKTLFLYRSSEQAHALLFVNGNKRVRTYSTRRRGRLPYYGRLSPKWRYVLEAEDLAGNRSAPVVVHPTE
jgi:hypothetical protein